MNIELQLPVKHVQVNQGFGETFLWYDKNRKKLVDFYKNIGLESHNGIDFKTKNGCSLYSAIDGKVHYSGKGRDGGICIMIYSECGTHGVLYYHNKKNFVRNGDEVKKGDLIGEADNTGKYTTADHLHFDLYLLKDGRILNRSNGHNGRIDPSSYFTTLYNGVKIKNKDWDKSVAYHRYYREKSYWAEYWYRFTPLGLNNKWTMDGRFVQRQLKARKLPLLNTEQVNAILYGGWDFKFVINPSMRPIYTNLKKSEYSEGVVPFL